MAESTTAKLPFLVELGTEELPPRALKTLASAFADGIVKRLTDAKLGMGEATVYASPRRLAVHINALDTQQADQTIQRRGPAVSAAFDADGNPTKAAEGFAKSCGMAVDQLDRLKTDKGEWLVTNIEEKGVRTADLLADIVAESLATLPIPKRMRWGDRDAEFVRPAHWLVMLLGDEIIPASVLGLQADRLTRGHRFHSEGDIAIAHADQYAALLKEQGHVVADFAERRQIIADGVQNLAQSLGGNVELDDDLLNEVTALVEWPVPVAGNFDREYLDIPSEVLITTMKDNQKYFPLFDASNQLMPMFITVSNIDSTDMDMVRKGNEVVIRPRLADAMFFWQQDRKQPLADRSEVLKSVVFQTKLGAIHDKTERVAKLAEHIAGGTGANVAHTRRAVALSKCDLVTEMVGEFASVQGIMGEYYARLDGEDEAVAVALSEQYLPRYADDKLAATPVGQALAIGDRLDTLVGIFAIGQKPTGVKDPFALRRLSLGVLRTMIEQGVDLDLRDLLNHAANGLQDKVDISGVVEEVFEFMVERLRAYYSSQGVATKVFDSVAALRPVSPVDFDRRIRAVNEFVKLPEAESLAAANKRINNILKKNQPDADRAVDTSLFEGATETTLYDELQKLESVTAPLFDAGDYSAALQALAQVRTPVDNYFDEVMVMADDEAVRNNRLSMLGNMRSLFSHVADIGLLQS
jgi:glycyl-tRNA synthetase beta chain